MVDFLIHLEHSCGILSSIGERDQLDEHWLSLCILHRQPVSDFEPGIGGNSIWEANYRSLSRVSRFVIWVLNKGGPKPAIVITATLLLIGNWLRYAGTRANGGIFGLAMFGQILIGLAQPFCLCAPTRYSDLWFSDKGRTSATAVASLANPLGAALGQLIDAEWASKPSDIPNMVLYISVIVSWRIPEKHVNT